MTDAPRPAFTPPTEMPHATSWQGQSAAWKPLREALPRLDAEAPQEPAAPAPSSPQPFQSGFEEGLQKAKQVTEGIVARYQQSVADLAQARAAMVQETEADLVRLALHIAGQVLLSDVSARQDFTARMVQRALSLLVEADRISLHVSSADMSGLMAKHPQLMGMPNVTLVEDENMALGGVIAESNLGRVDATLERRLAEMVALLMGEGEGL